MGYFCEVFLGAGDLSPAVHLLLAGRAIWNSGGHLLLLLFVSWEFGFTSRFFLLPPKDPHWARPSQLPLVHRKHPSVLCPEELWEYRWSCLWSSRSSEQKPDGRPEVPKVQGCTTLDGQLDPSESSRVGWWTLLTRQQMFLKHSLHKYSFSFLFSILSYSQSRSESSEVIGWILRNFLWNFLKFFIC